MTNLQISHPPIKVLFVCLGNICRSPMAEAVFAHLVQEANLADQFEIDSAGTGDYHIGHPAHEGTLDVLREKKISYNGRARQITAADLDYYDYIITMDDSNFDDVKAIGRGRAQVLPLLSFAPSQELTEVPDPYYHGRFDKTFDLVHEACVGLLEHICKSTFVEEERSSP
ncbi:MAG: low molecular weight protein-tyrosine-phosphatase [Abditibacteriaceae bacterium]